jgi:hypothetical protein
MDTPILWPKYFARQLNCLSPDLEKLGCRRLAHKIQKPKSQDLCGAFEQRNHGGVINRWVTASAG